ncbi:hypothetical protein BH23GEM11_BH23GEM11_14880 [soil metagenome]
MKASVADLATALAIPTVAALGGALAVYSGYDDAPGGLLMAVILFVGTVWTSLRAARIRS